MLLPTELTCTVPQDPPNGLIKLQNDGSLALGATATVECNTGYRLLGEPTITCSLPEGSLENATWMSVPECEGKTKPFSLPCDFI